MIGHPTNTTRTDLELLKVGRVLDVLRQLDAGVVRDTLMQDKARSAKEEQFTKRCQKNPVKELCKAE
jgi:hypothetical protein